MKFSEIKLPSNKKFGYFFSFVFLILFLLNFLYYSNFTIAIISIVLSITILIITLIIPKILYPLNISWMYLGYLISLIVSPIVLGIIFYLLITPIAMFLKIIKRDELGINNTSIESSWKNRQEIKYSEEYFNNQF